MTDVVQFPLVDLVFDARFYPRSSVNPLHVRVLEHALEGGAQLPPVIVAANCIPNVLVDGRHRVEAYKAQGRKTIAAILKTYANEQEILNDATSENAAHGLPYTPLDKVRILQLYENMGVGEIELARVLQTSPDYLRKLKPRYANLEETDEGVTKLRRVALKSSVRHLSGETITAEQAAAMKSAPGVSYLLAANQLRDALIYDLLPPQERHPALWSALAELAKLILEQTGEDKKAS